MGEEIFKLILVDLGVCIAVGILFDVLVAVFVRTKTCCCKVRYVLLLVMHWYVCKNVAAFGRACSIVVAPSPLSKGGKNVCSNIHRDRPIMNNILVCSLTDGLQRVCGDVQCVGLGVRTGLGLAGTIFLAINGSGRSRQVVHRFLFPIFCCTLCQHPT